MRHNKPIAWPLRPNGMRRRSSAARVLTKGAVSRPAGWTLRLLVLMAVAIPSLIVTSPGYVAFAEKLPDPKQVTSSQPEDTLIYGADGTTLLADLHPPGYQHYYEPLSDVGTLLPEAVISIEDKNFVAEFELVAGQPDNPFNETLAVIRRIEHHNISALRVAPLDDMPGGKRDFEIVSELIHIDAVALQNGGFHGTCGHIVPIGQ